MPLDLLLVDDEEGIRKVLGISLTDRGYRVHTAENGRKALALFDTLSPAIVLTDIKMPGLDGIDLLREIKRRDRETEVIMLTGHGDMNLAIKSLKHDATDYITKPIDDDILDLALRRARERITMRAQLRDYTINLEQMVAEKSRRLIEAERMAAVGETITGIAHAVKNIAGGLRGGAFIVEKGLEAGDEENIRRGWRMTHDNVVRIEELSLDLLNIAKPHHPSFSPTDPGLPIRKVYHLMRPAADRIGVALELQVEDDLAPISMEMEGIHRCLLNLVTNALDACSELKDSDPAAMVSPIALSCSRCPGGIAYRVKDHGGGMSEDVRAKLFQTFFTTKGSRGTGIGLMLTRKIVEAHHGVLEVDTRTGIGSTFTIRLPLDGSIENPKKEVDDNGLS